jgi:hypothetical protein
MNTFGFAFRSPDVVRFMLDRSKYSVCVIPEPDVVGAVARIITDFGKANHAGRKKVYLYKSLKALANANRNHSEVFSDGLHVMFDSVVLLKKKGIRIIDIDTKEQADWQVGKTLGSNVAKALQDLEPGLDVATRTKLTKHERFPEDDVNTDTAQSERERELKNRSLMIVIQDMQSKNASVRELICGFVVMYYIGKLFVSTTRKPVDLDGCSWVQGNKYKLSSVSKKRDPNVKTKGEARLAELLAGIKIKLTKQTLAKINNCFRSAEYATLIRAFSLIECGMPVSKACAETGASQSLVTMCARNLSNPVIQKLKEFSVPVTVYRKYVKRIRGGKTQNNEDSEIVATEKRRVITGKRVQAGKYRLSELLVTAGLAKPKADPADVLMQSKTPVRLVGDYKTYQDNKKKIQYELVSGKTYYIWFQSKKHKIKAV